jgi:DNA-binding transcriptional MocR family regulator
MKMVVRKKYIIEQIERDIYNKVLVSGEKLPSVRELCLKYGCSHMTAYNTLSDLCVKGIVISRDRSGHYVSDERAIFGMKEIEGDLLRDPSQAAIIPHLIETERHSNILPLGTAARLDLLLPIKKIFEKIPNKEIFFRKWLSSYSYPPGDCDLRNEIAKHMSWRKVNTLTENIVLTNGATEAMYISLLTLVNPGDCIIVASPFFFGTRQFIDQLKLKVIEIPYLKGGIVDLEKIELALLRNKEIKLGIFQVNFNNPDGALVSQSDRQALVDLFRDHDTYLVEDDTYGDLSHDHKYMNNLKSFDKYNDTVFSCSSFSKTLGPSFRVGWVIPPAKYIERVCLVKLSTSFSGNLANEKLIANFLKKRKAYERHLKYLNESFKDNMTKMLFDIENLFPSNITVTKPRGGFCLWVDLGKGFDSFNLYKELIKNNIAVSPGAVFSTENLYGHFIRINCAINYDEKVYNGLKTIAHVLGEIQ